MIGVLIALHGSRDPEWMKIAEGYKELLSEIFNLVEVGYLEFNSPSLRESLEALVDRGAEKVVVVPLFISLGTHVKADIPKALGVIDGRAVIKGREVKVVLARPIGVDRKVAEVLAERASEALKTLS